MWKQVVDQVGLRPSLANSHLKISFIPLHIRFLEGQQKSLSITDTWRAILMESLHWFLLLKLSPHFQSLTKQLNELNHLHPFTWMEPITWKLCILCPLKLMSARETNTATTLATSEDEGRGILSALDWLDFNVHVHIVELTGTENKSIGLWNFNFK